MIKCQNCGQDNSGSSNFCRFCGSKFQQTQPPKAIDHQQNPDRYQQTPRRPYSWQTDEFQVKEQSSEQEPSSRPTQQIDRQHPTVNSKLSTNQLIGNQQPQLGQQQSHLQQPQQFGQNQMQPQYQNTMSAGYHCPFCNSNVAPLVVKKVSPAGWAVFTVLLITTFIFFWIGLLIQEERHICPVCNARVG